MAHTSRPHPHHEHHPDGAGDADLAELLDLDAAVLSSHISEVTAWIRDLAGQPPPQRILDLGCGTGTGTFALLERFDRAEVTAMDVSAPMLGHLRNRARSLGFSDRVRTLEVDLTGEWPDLGHFDLAWASASLHHMSDPDHVLRRVRASLRSGGLVVLAELDSFPRFLPDDLGVGRPGLEARIHAALATRHAAEVPLLGSRWDPFLTGAGFTMAARRAFDIVLAPPLPPDTRRYAQESLRRARANLTTLLSTDDLATLDTILEGDGSGAIMRRHDLTVSTTRTIWVAGRP